MPKVLFRADADIKSGTGDLFSLIYLSEYFKNWERYFASRDTPEARDIFKRNKIGKVKYISREASERQEIDLLNKFIERAGISVVFIEITTRGLLPYRYLKAPFRACVNFDGKVPKGFDLVINWDVDAVGRYDRGGYPDASFLLGPEYVFLKKDLLEVARKGGSIGIRRNRVFKNILIFFGGFDEFDFTLKVIKSLEKIDSNLSLTAIVGAGYAAKDRLCDCLKKSEFRNYKILHNINGMWREYLKADIAIISGGLSLFEAVALKVPAAVIATYKHQIKRSLFFDKSKAALYLGFRKYSLSGLRRAIYDYRYRPFKKRILTNTIPQIIYERFKTKI